MTLNLMLNICNNVAPYIDTFVPWYSRVCVPQKHVRIFSCWNVLVCLLSLEPVFYVLIF